MISCKSDIVWLNLGRNKRTSAVNYPNRSLVIVRKINLPATPMLTANVGDNFEILVRPPQDDFVPVRPRADTTSCF